MQSLITQFPVNEAGMVDQFLGTAWDVVYNVYLKLPELTELNGQINNIPQMAQDAVDAAMIPAMEQIDAAVEEAKDWAELAESVVGKTNAFYPFSYNVSQPIYDVVAISGDDSATTTGLALWVQGAIEYDFTILNATQFVINSVDYPDGTGMGILVNARFDSIVQNFDDLLASQEAAFAAEQAERDIEFNQYLTAFGYIFKGDYGPTPITIDDPLDVIKRDGRIWGPLPSVPLPFATVNDWSVDQTKFAIVGDPTLRQDLAAVMDITDPAGIVLEVPLVAGGAWSAPSLLQLGNYRLWVDGSGKLRIKGGIPTSDTDGTVVGTQS